MSGDLDSIERSWLSRIPKVELHLHLEGAIPLDALFELVRKYGGEKEVPDRAALEARFRYRDFPHFIETWIWKNGFIREYDDFRYLAEAVANDLLGQNILYVEAFFSPGDFACHGLRPQGIAEAIRAGLNLVPGIRVALVADLIRDFGPERAARTLEEIAEVRDQGIVGIGIGGSEHDFPPEPFEETYIRARRFGFHTSAHAGEAAGPESVWGAIRALKVDRIGHGTRAAEDESLLDHIAAAGTAIEACPISNVKTGIIPNVASHPIRRFLDRGITVTVNTDDPKMFGNSLVDEYRALQTDIGFTREEIRNLILCAVRSSWLSGSDQLDLEKRIKADPAW